jgi:hypothetical protein
VIDLKHEIERELDMIDPPDLWDRIRADASDSYVAPALHLTAARRRRSTSQWLAAVAVVAAIALVGALTWLDDDQSVDTVPADTGDTGPTTTTPSEESVWSGPVRDPSDVVHRMTVADGSVLSWEDPLDASERWADVARVEFREINQGHWSIDLAASPPLLADVEPGVLIAYGLVFDTNADGAADYLVGFDNDAPQQGDFHVWVTDLASGETDEQVEPPYGYPVEFGYPDEREPDYPVFFTFLGDSRPAALNLETVRFYAWTSATRDGQVFAHDFAPDEGWITSDVP